MGRGLCHDCYNRKWRKDNPEKHRAGQQRRWLRQYGLTPETYEQLKKDQDYKCAICHKEKKLNIDHDHKTKLVRGLLCDRCNWILGIIERYFPECMSYLWQHTRRVQYGPKLGECTDGLTVSVSKYNEWK